MLKHACNRLLFVVSNRPFVCLFVCFRVCLLGVRFGFVLFACLFVVDDFVAAVTIS